MEIDKKQNLTDSLYDLEFNDFNNKIIQDNKIIFIIDKMYRVRIPTQGEQESIDHKCNLKQLEYSNQEGCISKNQLIKQLKAAGLFDVDIMEEEKEKFLKQLKQYRLLLATKSSDNKIQIDDLKNKINQTENKLKDLSIEMAFHLMPCLQSKLEKFIIEYTTFLVTEKLEGKEWIRVWETEEDFKKADSSLVERASVNVTWLLLNKRG